MYIDKTTDCIAEKPYTKWVCQGISAKVIADSISPDKIRITTFELEYPRFIHSELMTHRAFSRNAASSRAIPIKKKIAHVWNNPAMPVYWGKNQPGMKADEEISDDKKKFAKLAWIAASKVACGVAWLFSKFGLHKQIACRVLEPFETYKVIVTATDYKNFYWLRDHEDAQPEIQVLSHVMDKASMGSVPLKLDPGEWHLPYIRTIVHDDKITYMTLDGDVLTLEEAKEVSASCCAQVSYRTLNTTKEKAKDINNKLVYSEPVHASPTEHQATPMQYIAAEEFEEGCTSYNFTNNTAYSGNLRGWIQFRQLIKNNVKSEN